MNLTLLQVTRPHLHPIAHEALLQSFALHDTANAENSPICTRQGDARQLIRAIVIQRGDAGESKLRSIAGDVQASLNAKHADHPHPLSCWARMRLIILLSFRFGHFYGSSWCTWNSTVSRERSNSDFLVRTRTRWERCVIKSRSFCSLSFTTCGWTRVIKRENRP